MRPVALRVILVVLFVMALPALLHAQTGVVRGSVSDEAGRPLSGAHVTVVGSSIGTESRSDGSFELRTVPVGRQTLPISTDSRTVGTELEGALTPLAGLELRAVATIQNPRFTRFRYDFFVPGTNPLSGPQTRDYSGNRLNDVASVLTDVGASYAWRALDLFADYRYSGDRAANRPNTVTIPGFGELDGGVGSRFGRVQVRLQGRNLPNTQAIQQMAQRTGEDILRVNADGSAVSLVTSGPNAGTTTTSSFTTGLGIMPRTVQLSLAYDF